MDTASRNYRAVIASEIAADRSTRARVRRVAAWILEDPLRPRSVDDLADRAAVSVRTLTRLFRRETGTTPARFVERARVSLARALLDETDLAIGAVAARCGFASDERMRRAFHRSVGTSPRAYLRRASIEMGRQQPCRPCGTESSYAPRDRT